MGLLALASFAPALTNGFIADDGPLLARRLRGVGWGDLGGLFTQTYWGDEYPNGLYRPVALGVIAAERLLFGDATVPYHALGLLLHAANALLLLRVLGRLGDRAVAWMAAMVFACHPVHAEAVITVYGHVDLLAALFALVSIDRFLAMRAPNATRVVLWANGIAMAMAFAVALGCKESVLIVPLLTVLIRGLYRRVGGRGLRRWIGWPQAVLFAIVAAYFTVRYTVIGELGPGPEATVTYGYPLTARLKVMIVALAHHIRLAVLPWGQTTYYGHLRDSIFGRPWAEMSWLVIALVGAALVVRWTRSRAALLGLGWFAIGLLTVMHLAPIGAIVGERFLYLPSAGVALVIGAVLRRCQGNTPGSSPASSPASCPHGTATKRVTLLLLVAAAVAADFAVCRQWRNEESLWRHTIHYHPRSPNAHALLGLALVERLPQTTDADDRARLTAEAREHFQTALELNPHSADALRGLGLLAMQRGDLAQAAAYLQQAGRSRPHDPAIHDARDALKRQMEQRRPAHENRPAP